MARFTVLSVLVFFASTAMALRAKEGQVILDKLSDYELCQSKDYTGEWCHDALVRWVEAKPEDAFQAGKMTRKKMNAPVALEFFETSFKANKGDCKDEDVKLAVVGGLGLPASNEKQLQAAKFIGFEKCFNDMKTAIVEASTIGSYNFDNSCKELVKRKALTGLKAKKCETIK